ncbi:ATP-binding protein [Sphingomonas silueang]|uniref:ATP-binding protein n=1 Tax=Sphingomonas silueang TaxID=3156617 RepID=UPI0032B5DF60
MVSLAPAVPPPVIGTVLAISGPASRLLLDLGQIHALADLPDAVTAAGGQIGSQVRMRVGSRWVVASIRAMRLADTGEQVIAEVDFLGEGEAIGDSIDRFRRGVTRYPLPGTAVQAVTTDDLRRVYAADDRARIEIGHVHPTRDVRAALQVDALLGKHFALLGSTGTGKSTSAALILHRICEQHPQAHIVMVDPHGEYAAAFGDTAMRFDAGNLQLPYWLLDLREHCELLLTSSGAERQVDADILGRCLLAARAKHRLAQEVGRLTVDSPIPYLLTDLLQILQQDMGRMNRAGDTAPYLRIRGRIDEVRADPRYGFMFSGLLVADTMAALLKRVFRLPAEGRPVSIVDVSGMPSEVTGVVVSVLARLVFDYALWSRDEPRRPILLVCEEAHRYVPNERHADGSPVAQILSRIAKEGRKYGVALGLITQRPSDLAEGVLSQCGTILTMRLNNERDQAFVRAAMPEGARGFLDAIPALRNRECIVVGEGVATPIRVLFDDLEPERCPASTDPSFSTLWRQTGEEDAIVARTIRRWRAQGR